MAVIIQTLSLPWFSLLVWDSKSRPIFIWTFWDQTPVSMKMMKNCLWLQNYKCSIFRREIFATSRMKMILDSFWNAYPVDQCYSTRVSRNPEVSLILNWLPWKNTSNSYVMIIQVAQNVLKVPRLEKGWKRLLSTERWSDFFADANIIRVVKCYKWLLKYFHILRGARPQ